jgi:hypothetical protein
MKYTGEGQLDPRETRHRGHVFGVRLLPIRLTYNQQTLSQ